MQKILLLFSFLCCQLNNFAQTQPAATVDKKDSTEILQDLMDILGDANAQGSYLMVNVGLGNRIFNVQNNVLNSKLTPVNSIIFSPSLTYHNKSGLYVSGTANLLNDSKNGFRVNEYSATAGYELPENNKADFTIAYTHIFVNDVFSAYASPIHNDLYAAYLRKKTWLRPGIAIDFSGGEYGDVKTVRLLYDSINSKLISFALVPSVSHEFAWNKVFGESDGITLTPSLLLNIGKSRQALHHTTNAPNLLSFLNKKGRLPKFENTKFQPESVGLNLYSSYGAGQFSIGPEMYIDYFLQKTKGNPWAAYFTLTFRYSFW